MATETNQLFFPWYFLGEFRINIMNTVYNPCFVQKQKIELFRLSSDLETLDISKYEMIYINIGAANVNNYMGMIRQLPLFVESKQVRTLVILIDKFNSIPSVLKHKEFIKISYNTYSNGIIDIKIYNTFLPTWLKARIQKFTDKEAKKTIIENQENSRDKEFVYQFYENLRTFINRSNQPIYFVSTATFMNNEATENSGNINLELFPEVLLLVGMEKFILLVWPYNSTYYYSWGTMKRINYTNLINIDEENLFNTNAILGLQYKMKSLKE